MRDDHDRLTVQRTADDHVTVQRPADDRLTVQHPADDEHSRGVQTTVPSRARLGGRPDRVAATAANIPLGPNTLSGGPPWDTVERLKEGGVVLWAMLSPTGRFPAQDAEFAPRELPLSLDDAQPGGYFEGQPGHIWADRILAQVKGYNIDLWVFYGGDDPTAHPTEPTTETRAAAQAQLARLVVPARL